MDQQRLFWLFVSSRETPGPTIGVCGDEGLRSNSDGKPLRGKRGGTRGSDLNLLTQGNRVPGLRGFRAIESHSTTLTSFVVGSIVHKQRIKGHFTRREYQQTVYESQLMTPARIVLFRASNRLSIDASVSSPRGGIGRHIAVPPCIIPPGIGLVLHVGWELQRVLTKDQREGSGAVLFVRCTQKCLKSACTGHRGTRDFVTY